MMLSILPNRFVVVEDATRVVVRTSREDDVTLSPPWTSTDDSGSLCGAAVVILAVLAEVEADLVTLTRHVVHDEVAAEAGVK